MAIEDKESIAFTRGYAFGMKTINRIYEETFRKNYLVRKWIWWTFLITSFVSDLVLLWHLVRETL